MKRTSLILFHLVFALFVMAALKINDNPFDEDDVWNLKTPFYENKEQSAPSFHYILQDCIIVRE